MNKSEVFKTIQQYLSDVPLLLIGTGGTIPCGIPGMVELSEHLIHELDDKYRDDIEWIKFTSNLKSGKDLESALTNLTLKQEILDDIAIQTWHLVNKADLNFLYGLINHKVDFPIANLIKRFYEPNPQCVNIITTNYDRIIEYACDQIYVNVDKRFIGYYIKSFSNIKLQTKKIVNLIKVHGSLDLYKDKDGFVYSIPLQGNIPNGLIPEIVTPGENKYRSILTGEYRDLVHIADDLINTAKSYLCIGYGFNDEQIQRNIISGIHDGKPIVVVTKAISDKSLSLIERNSEKYVIIRECKEDPTKTEFIVNNEFFRLEGTYWTINGLLMIV